MIQKISGKIIVVDDDDVFADVIAERLQNAGFLNVTVYTDPSETLMAIRSDTRPSIVITDFNMPGLNGVELIDEINRHHPEIDGVIITGNPAEARDRPHRHWIFDKSTKFYPELIAHTLGIIRSHVQPLLDACPEGTEKPDRPIKDIRVSSNREKPEWIEALQPADISHLIRHHLSCMNICAE